MSISIQQVLNRDTAIGLAVTYVAAHQPFGSYRADRLIGSITGQVQRRHYAFAVREGAIVGFIGWALCSPDIAEAWIERGQAQGSEQCQQGEVVVPIFIVADETPALRRLIAYGRGLNKGKAYMGRRAQRENRAVRKGRTG